MQAFKAVAKHRAGIEGGQLLATPCCSAACTIRSLTHALLPGVVRVSAFDTTTPTPQQENSCEVLIFPAGG